MESNGAEASRIRREIDSLKSSKIEIERCISALESQLRDIKGDGRSQSFPSIGGAASGGGGGRRSLSSSLSLSLSLSLSFSLSPNQN
ncbi:hypothetical protein RHGRI_023293 [Rhododendron griersonianum]|uniref:Uncharacterized protein n=1 Tax=Rhododendron griersonianum TaxID=479676 RepID=A0AAV6J4R0_9ERIC|nr:hypothetical protein RHGRI_023293 [Rhododendron griersonianum]